MKHRLVKQIAAITVIAAFGVSLTGCTNPLMLLRERLTENIVDDDFNIDYEGDSEYEVDFDSINDNSTASPEVQEKVQSIVKEYANDKMNSFEKAKAMHDWLVTNVDYVITDNCHTAYGALMENQAVCDGYSYAYRLLMSALGYDCRVVYGYSEDEAHAWNVINLDGTWYQMDVTWDDPMINGMTITDGSNMSYDYFLLNDETMYKDHTVVYDWNQYDIPECTSTAGMDWIAPTKEALNSQYEYDYNYGETTGQYGYDYDGCEDCDPVSSGEYPSLEQYVAENSPYWTVSDENSAFELAVTLIESGYSSFTLVFQPGTYSNNAMDNLVDGIIEGVSNGYIYTAGYDYSQIYYGSYSENGVLAITVSLY